MIVVTGSTGHLGAHLLFELATRNRRVRALYHSAGKLEQVKKIFSYYTVDVTALMEKIEWVRGDITDTFLIASLLENAKQVYHTAGFVSFREKDKRKLLEVNMKGTANLVNECLHQNIHKICHVSSIAALGESQGGEWVTESMIWNAGSTASTYSISKFRGEMEVWRGIHEGLQAVIVNPSVIVGPGMWYSQSGSLFKQIHKGLNYYPTGSAGFVDVRDVARAMIMLMDSEVTGERYILNSENMSHRAVLEIIAG